MPTSSPRRRFAGSSTTSAVKPRACSARRARRPARSAPRPRRTLRRRSSAPGSRRTPTRVEADDYAERIRAEAEEYSQAERGKADAYALRMREEAGEQAGKIIADGQSRREALEEVISDLAERRDQLLDELEEIAGSIAGTASRARGEPRARRQRLLPRRGGDDGSRHGRDRVSDIRPALEAALSGGPERHHSKLAEQDKLEARERVERLIDAGSFAEEALLANWESEGLGADGVITGTALIGGRKVALMANDPTVKAGSWGPKTVEKILRIQERALKLAIPMIYLVDSAGARITDQVQMFPGRRGAGRIFYNQVRLSGAGAAGLPAVRAERRRGRLHPGLLRRRDHAGRQRLDVPGLPADGGDGDRRERQPRGDGRRQDAHRSLRLRPFPRRQRRRGDRDRPSLPLLHARQLERGAAVGSAGRARLGAADRRDHPRRREPAVRHARADRGAGRRGLDCSRCTSAGRRS